MTELINKQKTIATGNFKIMGVVSTTEGEKDFTEVFSVLSNNLSGEVVSDYLKIGGTYSLVDNDLKNYKGGDGSWSNVVCLPKGTQFSIRLISPGSAMNMARIEVTTYEDEEYSLEELNCLQEVKLLLEKYPKDMIEKFLYQS